MSIIKKSIFLIVLVLLFVDVKSQESFQSLNALGNEEVNSENYKIAMEYFSKALEIGTENKADLVWTATLAATCATQLNLTTKVIGFNNIAIQNGCTDILVIDQQLDLGRKNKDLKTCEEVLLYARKLDGYYEKYTIKLLYFYYNNQQYDKTIVSANEVLEFNPNHSNSLYLKSVALSKIGKEDEAIQMFKQILKHEPENSKVNLQLGLIYFNRASAIFDKVNQTYKSLKEPKRTDYYNYIQEIKKAEGDYKNCLPLLEQAYKTNTKDYIKNAITLTQGRLRQIEQD